MKTFNEWLEVRKNNQQESLVNAIGTGLEAGYNIAKTVAGGIGKAAGAVKGAVGNTVDKARWAMMSPEEKKRYQDERENAMSQLLSRSTNRNVDASIDDMKARMDDQMAQLRNRAQGNRAQGNRAQGNVNY